MDGRCPEPFANGSVHAVGMPRQWRVENWGRLAPADDLQVKVVSLLTCRHLGGAADNGAKSFGAQARGSLCDRLSVADRRAPRVTEGAPCLRTHA